MVGLGSIVGTGVFVSIGIAAGIAGPAVILAILLAGGLAACDALNSAQLAAAYPVSGGTYEYGYKYLKPWLGFTAGWMLVWAKTASAATAAIGFSGYLLNAVGRGDDRALLGTSVATVALIALVVLSGIRQSNRVNIAIVTMALASLYYFVLAGLPVAAAARTQNLTPFFRDSSSAVFQACALMFVAFTGYGRIARLGNEVREPQRTIPRAIIASLILSALLYVSVALVAIAAVGADALRSATEQQAAPLEIVMRRFPRPQVHLVVAIGAITAMLGALLNLVVGASWMLLAMGRRGDMPRMVATLNEVRTTPYVAAVIVTGMVAALALTGSVKTTWSISAFTVLVYCAITNCAALRLSDAERLYPRWIAWTGLAACLFLAFWVEWQIWATGVGLIVAGLVWHRLALRILQRRTEN